MATPYLSEIKIFSFNFPPKGWALCNGQLLPINQNQALFSLLGTTYGGNGQSTFALPNLQGMAPLQQGQGPGLSLYDLGQTGGEQTVTLLQTELPAHAHGAQAYPSTGDTNLPAANVWASAHTGKTPFHMYAPDAPANRTAMSPQGLSIAGGSLPHNNMPPYLVLTFCIALQGIFPPRQ
jgi:microcystin-dependent protein